MQETFTLHFGLGHLAPDQPFTLRVGSRSYALAPHTIPMQYYDETGKLTQLFPLPYPAGTCPDASSVSAETVRPNGAPYSVNQNNGLSMAQMMAATNPPTSWSPADQATAHRDRALAAAGR